MCDVVWDISYFDVWHAESMKKEEAGDEEREEGEGRGIRV